MSLRLSRHSTYLTMALFKYPEALPMNGHFRPSLTLMVGFWSHQYTFGMLHPDPSGIPQLFVETSLFLNIWEKCILTTAINAAFKHWCHYLEGSGTLIDVITDHHNLQYFSTTKVLTWHQVRISEFLSQFNLVICFCPGKLSTKPEALTRCWDIYPREGSSNYA